MAFADKYVTGLEKKDVVVTAVVLYLGAETRKNKDGMFMHQFALLPSPRDPRGGVVSLKHSQKIPLKENSIYMLEASSASERPDNHFGVSVYWLRNLSNFKEVASLQEVKK